jgi:hypothetical protein
MFLVDDFLKNNNFMKDSIAILIFVLLPFYAFSQEIGLDVYGIQTNPHKGPFLVTLDTLREAKTLKDINDRYKPSWVEKYISVEIISSCNGTVKKALGTSDQLTQEQLAILAAADIDCLIDVKIHYLPKNNLKDNPSRKMNFALRVVPIYQAKYIHPSQNLTAYLKQNTLAKLSEAATNPIKFVQINFTIDEKGAIINAKIIETSECESTNETLLAAICNMKNWQPALNANGEKVQQDFVFTIGTDLLRCDYRTRFW